MSDPEMHDGTQLELGPDTVIIGLTEDGLTVYYRGYRLPVIYKEGGIGEDAVGVYVSILGIFHRDGYIEAKKLHVHRKRKLKMAVSVITVLGLTVMFGLCYRFDFRKLVFEEKRCRT